jgi:hypothetical protein
MAKTTTKKASAPKRQAVQHGDQTPEAKATPKEQSDAAKKMFADADEAARAGFPPDMTVEQHENHVRRAALGY